MIISWTTYDETLTPAPQTVKKINEALPPLPSEPTPTPRTDEPRRITHHAREATIRAHLLHQMLYEK